MGKHFSRSWLRNLMTFCLLLILVSLVGHFLADATGVSLDAWLTADLHSGFTVNPLLALVVLLIGMTIRVQPARKPTLWYPSPTAPPPTIIL
jgi:hypothetical protein